MKKFEAKDYDIAAMEVIKRELVDALEGNKESLISAFPWKDTPEGHDFWYDMSFGTIPMDTDRLQFIYDLAFPEDRVVAKDQVNSPDHYNNGEIECIAYLKDNMSKEGFLGYLEGNCKKYLHRWQYKNKPEEDLNKALWYLERLIKERFKEI